MTNIKVSSSYYPTNPLSQDEWMREFRVGVLYRDQPNAFGMTFDEFIRYLKTKKNQEENSNNFSGNNNY